MSIAWGAWNGHLRVGIDYSISPSSPSHSDTSVKVTWKFYLETDGWNFSGDVSYLHEGATGWGGTTTTFTNNLSSGSMLVDTQTVMYGISYNSGSVSANANLTGAYNGATPSASRTVNLPNRPYAKPSAPGTPTASNISSSQADIAWTMPTDDGGSAIDQTSLMVSTDSSFSSFVFSDSTVGSSPKTVTGLKANTKYYARVQCHNSAGWSAWSGTGSFTTTSATPTTPTGLSVTGKTQTEIILGWKASANNGGTNLTYTVDRATNSTFTAGLQTKTGLTTTSATFTGLAAGTTYYFRVKAVNSLGSSSESSTVSGTTQSATTYRDTGDFVTLVNNLASAVGGKLAHLGTFAFRGTTAAVSLASGSVAQIDHTTQIQACTQPDPPSYAAGGTFTIQYPGTYLIEFFACWPGSTNGQAMGQLIYVNGIQTPTSTNPKGGAAIAAPWVSNTHAYGNQLSIVRKLDVGDTVHFNLYQTTGSAVVLAAEPGSDLTSWCRITMVGL